MKLHRFVSHSASVLLLLLRATAVYPQAPAVTYDLVIHGGRVIDPETGLDAIRDVGIIQHTILVVSPGPIHGKRTLEATGLVVSPGFIDLHQHGADAG